MRSLSEPVSIIGEKRHLDGRRSGLAKCRPRVADYSRRFTVDTSPRMAGRFVPVAFCSFISASTELAARTRAATRRSACRISHMP
jgi:hypothetical protein